jgi:hypothetical protein
MSGDPLFCFICNGEQCIEVIETVRSAVAPCAGLILEWPGEGRCEERSLFAVILPDRGLDIAAAKRVSWFLVVGSHLVSSFV